MIPRLSYFYFKINNPRHLRVTGQALRPVFKKMAFRSVYDLCEIYFCSLKEHRNKKDI